MKIAIVTAMFLEMVPILNKLGTAEEVYSFCGVDVYRYAWQGHSLYLAQSGVGEIRAAITVQLLVDKFAVDAVINFGLAGSLCKTLQVGELVLVDRVCHYQFDTSRLDGTKVGQYEHKSDVYFHMDEAIIRVLNGALPVPLRLGAVASGDVFVADPQQKQYLADAFGCALCEMEMAGIALACERNGVALTSIKAISDLADDSADISFAQIVQMGVTHYESILPTVLQSVASIYGKY